MCTIYILIVHTHTYVHTHINTHIHTCASTRYIGATYILTHSYPYVHPSIRIYTHPIGNRTVDKNNHSGGAQHGALFARGAPTAGHARTDAHERDRDPGRGARSG